MAQKDKILDILSLAQLSDEAKIARLAHRWIGKHVSGEQAKAIAKVYFDAKGAEGSRIAKAFLDEKHRQERLRNERHALREASKLWGESLVAKYRYDPQLREKRIMEIAQRTFGPAVKENFNEDTLSLMSLISGEDRWYQVRWLDAGFSPKRSALIEVVTTSKGKGSQRNRFLLYKHDGRVLVARTTARDLKGAWGSQLPESFMVEAGALKQDGWSFQMDYEDQAMVLTRGSDEDRVEWTGRTVDE